MILNKQNVDEVVAHLFSNINEEFVVDAIAKYFVKCGADLVNDMIKEGDLSTPDANDVRDQAINIVNGMIGDVIVTVVETIKEMPMKTSVSIDVTF